MRKSMRDFYDVIFNKVKLFILWWTRIFFAPQHFKTPFLKKIYYNINGGFMADQIALYNLNRHNKKEYLSEFDWYKSRIINEPYNFILNNKVVCTQLLQQYIKTPTIFVMKNKGVISSFDNVTYSYEDIYKLLKTQEKLFIKPINAGKGKGVHFLCYQEDKIYIDNKKVTEEDFFKLLRFNDNWFISEAIEQSDYLNELYDKTTNTIRFITLRDSKTNKMKVFFAVQRIGTSKTIPVDNGSKGALVAKIDLETGVLSEAKSLHSKEVHEIHPDSKKPIKGVKIPNWKEIKEEMLELANKFPYLKFVAWDILLTNNGICIIEANTSSGVNIIQLWGGQRNKELGNFYREHKIIK